MTLMRTVAIVSLSLTPGLGAGANTYRGKWIEISAGSKVFKVTDSGAKGDGKTDDTKAVQAAFDAAAAAGGGTVQFPTSKDGYLVTAFHFSGNNTVMELEHGVRVIFDDDQSKYDGNHNLIEAEGLNNIGIVGAGIIDGKGPKWWACRDKGCFRPKMLYFHHSCTQVLIKDSVFKDSPNHVLELMTDYAELAGVTVYAPPSEGSDIAVNGTYGPSHNTDAVDVHGTPFYIHDCHFDTGDDNIAVHASDLLVEDCYFGHGHGASIGSVGSDNALKNITFRNSIFENTGCAAKIKTHAGAKNSYVKDVTWENLVLHNVEMTISIDMFYDHGKNETTDFNISGITIKNVTAYGTKTDYGKSVTAGIFHCQETSPCHDIHLQDIHHVDAKTSFDCYNAYGDYSDVSPTPCLISGGPSGCNVDACFARCVEKYGGSIADDSYDCAKGCAGMGEGKITDKNKYCSIDAGKRYDSCVSHCAGASSDEDKVKQCKYGCEFWQHSAFSNIVV